LQTETIYYLQIFLLYKQLLLRTPLIKNLKSLLYFKSLKNSFSQTQENQGLGKKKGLARGLQGIVWYRVCMGRLARGLRGDNSFFAHKFVYKLRFIHKITH